jgi:two-component system CheB/CheR fusion protein
MKLTPVVGIGASAGGLKEIESFFKNMPNAKEVAFVLIQHLSPDYKSMLAEIVTHYTEMNVTQITDNLKVEAGNLYIIPPNKLVTIAKNRLKLSEIPEDKIHNLPIDVFFKSLRESLAEKAVAVILSGSGSDGTLGIKEVKEKGGLIVVQDPSTADYDGMPNSAIKTGIVDFVLPVEQMPKVILDYVENEFKERNIIFPDGKQYESLLKQILTIVQSSTGHDFAQYKRNTLSRRIQRRLTVNGFNNLKSYLDYLKENPDEVSSLFKEMLISVTTFFREPDAYTYYIQNVLPKVLKNHKNNSFRLWVPACATGEEAYTWAILLHEYFSRNNINLKLQIFASDIDIWAIDKARLGIYPDSIASVVPKNLLNQYFLKEPSGYLIKKSIRESVIFADHNIIQHPPYSKLDLISCRNLLIYLDVNAQEKLFNIFHYALNNDGHLVLGGSESLGSAKKYYNTVSRSNKIFSKQTGVQLSKFSWNYSPKSEITGRKTAFTNERAISEATRKFVLDKYMPPCVVVNSHGQMVYIEGKTGQYLEMSTGQVNFDIMKVLKPGLKVPVHNAIRKVKSSGQPEKLKRIKIDLGENLNYVDIVVSPLKVDNQDSPLISIIFKEKEGDAHVIDDSNYPEQSELLELEKELADKEEYLQNTIEELETTNEELKSANEEAQSTNEELQSTNEELETSKEELRSVNEELTTTNNELNRKVEELYRANNEISNLLKATEIATIFLDRELCIYNYTPAINEIVKLFDTDIGRPIKQFTNKLEEADFENLSREVLKSLVPFEKEVESSDGKFYWMRITPYRTTEDVIEGVVITLTNITEKKEKENELIKYKTNLEELVDKKTAVIAENEKLLNQMGHVAKIGGIRYYSDRNEIITTPELYSILGLKKGSDITRKCLYDLFEGDSKMKIMKAFNGDLKTKKRFEANLTLITKDNSEKSLLLIANSFPENKSEATVIYGSIQDISDIKKTQEALKEKVATFKQILNNSILGAHMFESRNGNLYLVEYNPAANSILGINHEKLLGKDIKEAFPATDPEIIKKIVQTAEKGTVWSDSEIVYEDDQISGIFESFYFQAEPGKVVAMFHDVTEKEKSRKLLQENKEKLEELNSTKDKLFSIISHDIKKPFVQILAVVEMFKSGINEFTKEELQNIIFTISESAQETYGLLDNLLNWAKLQLKKSNIELISCDLTALIRDEVLKIKRLASKKDLKLDFKNNNSIFAKVDSSSVSIVIRNLLHNAIKFSEPGEDIIISIKKDKKSVQFSVTDNGMGIPEKMQKSLFDINVNSSRDGTSGEPSTGIGLILCKDLIENHKGTLSIKSAKNKGTTMTVSLPL